MFTFQSVNPFNNKASNPHLHQIKDPTRLLPSHPLTFTLEASEPLNQISESKEQSMKISEQIDNIKIQHSLQLQEMKDKLQNLYEEYKKEKKQHEIIKEKYIEGESLFVQLESENHSLRKQIDTLKKQIDAFALKKRLQRDKSKANKQKDIPVVKISVPSHKNFGNQSEREAVYRQMKSASEELTYLKKILEGEKQKADHTKMMMNKAIEQIKGERDMLKLQLQFLKEEKKSINSPKTGNFNFTTDNTTEAQKTKKQLQRLENIHRSCDALIGSKQMQITQLKDEIKKMKQQVIYTREFCGLDESKLFSYLHSQDKIRTLQHLKLHLKLSSEEIRIFEECTTNINKHYIEQIEELKSQLDWLSKKTQHQTYELDRVYELLRDKKVEVEQCYREMRSGKKYTQSSPGGSEEDSRIKSLYKSRKDFSS